MIWTDGLASLVGGLILVSMFMSYMARQRGGLRYGLRYCLVSLLESSKVSFLATIVYTHQLRNSPQGLPSAMNFIKFHKVWQKL